MHTTEIRETATAIMESGVRLTAGELTDKVIEQLAGIFADDADEAARKGWLHIIKWMLHTPTRTKQMSLPGLDLPVYLTIEGPEHIYHVRTRFGTWEELLAHQHVSDTNMAAVVEKNRLLRESIEELRPYMESYPNRTLEEAIALLDAASSTE